jgi:hypothetical protein
MCWEIDEEAIAAMSLSHDTQFGGGFHGGETSFAQLYMRLITDAAVNASQSSANLYLDVVAAFATMLRRIILDIEDGDEKWLASLRHAGFSDADIHVIYDHVCDHSWLQNVTTELCRNDFSDPASIDCKLMEQLYSNSWVSQEGIPNVLSIGSGSNAGTPLADLVHSMCMSRVLTYFREALSSLGLDSFIAIGQETLHVHDVSFIDDVAIPVIANASTLCKKVGDVADCAYESFSSFGMLLNSSPGKSEAVLGFYGPGSKAAKKAVFVANDTIPIKAGAYSALRVVSCYQHVGTLSPSSCDVGEEVSKRNGMMRSESRNLSRRFLEFRASVLRRRSV